MSDPRTIDAESRQHYLDWLRLFAFVVLIGYHAGMYFVTWGWHLKSDNMSTLLEPLMWVVNPWRLALLFFIAGVALRFATLKGSPYALLVRRSTNLFVALVFGMLVVVAPQAYFELHASGEIESGAVAFYGRYLAPEQDFSIITPTWNHLWFLPYLLSYTIVLILLRSPILFLGDKAEGSLSKLARGPAYIVFPILVSAPFIAFAVWLDPIFPTTHMFINDWATHAHALTAMMFGFLFALSPSFWRLVDRSLVPATLVSAALAITLFVACQHLDVLRPAVGDIAFRVVRAFYAWTVILSLVALARRYLSRTNSHLRYFTRAILPYYMLHQSVLVAIGYVLIGRGYPLWLEGVLMVGVTVLVCVTIYELAIRRSRTLSFLFGLGWSRDTGPASLAWHGAGHTDLAEPSTMSSK